MSKFLQNNYIYFLTFIFFTLLWRVFLDESFRGNGIFFQDDLYYYLKIANQFWNIGYFSFDGLEKTNGFQPLWQFVLVFLSVFFEGENLIRSSLILNIFLIILFFFCSFKLLQRLRLPLLPLYISIFCVISLPTLGQFLFNGMETALLSFFIILALNKFCDINDSKFLFSNAFLFGIFSGFSMLSRLDSFIFFIIPYLFLLIKYKKTFFVSSSSHLLIVVPYLIWIYSDSGSILPISGAVKGIYSTFNNIYTNPSFNDYLSYSYVAFSDSLPYLKYSSFFAGIHILNILKLNYYIQGLLSLLNILIFVIPIYLIFVNRVSDKRLVKIIFFSFLSYLIFIIYFYNFYQIGLDNWTYGFSGFFLLYTGFLVFGFKRIEDAIYYFFKKFNPLLFFLVISLSQVYPYLSYIDSKKEHITFGGKNNNLYIKASNWANENLPENSIIGAWAAGQLGFNLKFKTIQLEGLVNSNDFIDVLSKKEFHRYTCDKSIDYIFLSALYQNQGSENFSTSDLYRKRSAIRTYRGIYLDQIWEYLNLEWVYEENFSTNNSLYSSFFIWSVDKNLCDNLL